MAVDNSAREQPSDTRREGDAGQAQHMAGLVAAFGRGAELGPQVLALQRSLLGGLAGSQRREAERLTERSGEDPRATLALERAGRAEVLRGGLELAAAAAGRLIAGIESEGLLHGYVRNADGSPAPDHTVRLKGIVQASGGRPGQASSKTDPSGYFRVELGRRPSRRRKAARQRFTRLADRLAAAADGGESPEPNEATSIPAGTKVDILDARNRLVFEDPDPPRLDAATSSFRIYVLEGDPDESDRERTQKAGCLSWRSLTGRSS